MNYPLAFLLTISEILYLALYDFFFFQGKGLLALSCYSWCYVIAVAGSHIISNLWSCFLTFCHLPRLKFF